MLVLVLLQSLFMTSELRCAVYNWDYKQGQDGHAYRTRWTFKGGGLVF